MTKGDFRHWNVTNTVQSSILKSLNSSKTQTKKYDIKIPILCWKQMAAWFWSDNKDQKCTCTCTCGVVGWEDRVFKCPHPTSDYPADSWRRWLMLRRWLCWEDCSSRQLHADWTSTFYSSDGIVPCITWDCDHACCAALAPVWRIDRCWFSLFHSAIYISIRSPLSLRCSNEYRPSMWSLSITFLA